MDVGVPSYRPSGAVVRIRPSEGWSISWMKPVAVRCSSWIRPSIVYSCEAGMSARDRSSSQAWLGRVAITSATKA
ncbi:hypothetical protein D3C72_2153290 [compost metagenome]